MEYITQNLTISKISGELSLAYRKIIPTLACEIGRKRYNTDEVTPINISLKD